MPEDCEAEALARDLDGLDEAIRRPGDDVHPLRDRIEPLVVERAHGDLVRADRAGEQRALLRLDRDG